MFQLEIRTIKKFKNGGVFKEYASISKTQTDYSVVKNVGIEFARLGKSAASTPVLHFKSPEYAEVYGALENTKYYRKCPDLLIDGEFYEVETYMPPFSKNKVSNMLKKGVSQSSRIIINNTKGASDRFIRKLIHDRINKGQTIIEVWLYEKGKIRLVHKKQ